MLPIIGVYVDKEIDIYTKKVTMKLANEEDNLLEDLAGSEDLSIFESESVKDLIEFKWNRFGFYFNLFGFLVHGFNVAMIFLYIDYVYINGSTDSLEIESHVETKQKYLKIICALVSYPLFYETV